MRTRSIMQPIDVEPLDAKRVSDTLIKGRCPKCRSKDVVFMEDPITMSYEFRCNACGYFERHSYEDADVSTRDLSHHGL